MAKTGRLRTTGGPIACAIAVLAACLPLAARGQNSHIEEVLGTEPVGANQLELKAVVLRAAGQASSSEAVMSLPMVPANGAALKVQARDSQDRGYRLQWTPDCATSAPCEFRWNPARLNGLSIGVQQLWPLARVATAPGEHLFIPVCLCEASRLPAERPAIDIVLVPTRPLHLRYTIEDAGRRELQSGSLRNIAPGQPVTLSYQPAAGETLRRVSLKVHYMAAEDGPVERYAEQYAILWR